MPVPESPSATLPASAPGLGLLSTARQAQRSRLADYFELTKPRLSLLSIITAVVGYLAARPAANLPLLFSLLVGTSLAAGGAAALNQWLEHRTDARMVRTRGRPIPAGALSPAQALAFGLVLSLSGVVLLAWGAHPLAALLAAATILSYVLVYTPLKTLSVRNTLVGAVPGAIPPLIGWAAATGALTDLAWMIFALLFTWQMPHFYAIAWTHRHDYRRGGLRMLPELDPSGLRTARESLLFTLLLLLCSLAPWAFGFTSALYGVVALLAGLHFLRQAWAFFRAGDRRDPAARRLFLASLGYLPLVLAVLVIDLLWIP